MAQLRLKILFHTFFKIDSHTQYAVKGLSTVGGTLFSLEADHLIVCSIFNVKHDGTIDFSINQKSWVHQPIKFSVFSRRDLYNKTSPLPGIEPGTFGFVA